MDHSSSTPMADTLALVCAVAMVVGFLFMPWLSFFGVSLTGWNLLALSQAASDPNSTFHSDNTGTFWFVLILAAGVLGLVTSIWGLRSPTSRRAASKWSLATGLVALLPLVIVLVELNGSTVNLMSFLGIGFWATLLGSIGLVVQAFLSRPTVDAGWTPSTHTYGSSSASNLVQTSLPRVQTSPLFQPLQGDTQANDPKGSVAQQYGDSQWERTRGREGLGSHPSSTEGGETLHT